MGAGTSCLSADQIDAASLHALALQLRKPALVCKLIIDHEIDGLTAIELDEASVNELVSSKLDQKKVWAAVKQFRQAQEVASDTTEAVDTQWLARRVTELEHEVWELRSSIEELRNAPRASPPSRLGLTAGPLSSSPPKDHDDDLLNIDERVKLLEDEILALCDAAPQGSMLAANLPRLYYYRYGRNLDFRSLGFLKLSQLLAKMSRIEFDGSHRALVSKKMLQPRGCSGAAAAAPFAHAGTPMPAFFSSHLLSMTHDHDDSPGSSHDEEGLLPSYLLGENPLS